MLYHVGICTAAWKRSLPAISKGGTYDANVTKTIPANWILEGTQVSKLDIKGTYISFSALQLLGSPTAFANRVRTARTMRTRTIELMVRILMLWLYLQSIGSCLVIPGTNYILFFCAFLHSNHPFA